MTGAIGVLVLERQTLAYDLFAVAMIMINTVYPNRFNKTDRWDPAVTRSS